MLTCDMKGFCHKQSRTEVAVCRSRASDCVIQGLLDLKRHTMLKGFGPKHPNPVGASGQLRCQQVTLQGADPRISEPCVPRTAMNISSPPTPLAEPPYPRDPV